MKKLIVMMMLVLPMLAMAQDLVHFVLMPDGTYQTEDGKDFVVVPFEGKTAHQIYQELATNVGSVYKEPSEVMSGVEDASIKIRAYKDCLWYNKALGLIVGVMGGYYQLEFRIRDGRVRVSAPIVEDPIFNYSDGHKYEQKYSKMVGKWFKNGELKDNSKEKYNRVVSQMNGIVNSILHISAVQDAQDDW